MNFHDNANTTTAKKDSLALDPTLDLVTGRLVNIALPPVADPANPPATHYTLYCDYNGMTDLWMLLPARNRLHFGEEAPGFRRFY